MDAYSSYMIRLSEARLGELRREAAEHALSRAARRGRASVWARARQRLLSRRLPAPVTEPAVAFPAPVVEADLRRSA